MVKEFESSFERCEKRHHEQMLSVQKAFSNDVQALDSVLKEMGIPFTENNTKLIVLDSKEVMSGGVVQAIKTVKQKGQSQDDHSCCLKGYLNALKQ